MGVVLTDFVLETVIRNGLTAIRDNNARIDDLFSTMTSSYLSDKFGQSTIDRIKTWVNEDRIHIVQGFPIKDSDIPCISITLQAAVEDTSLAVMNDFAEEINFDENPDAVEEFTPVSYDSTTGFVSVADGVDLSDVTIAMKFSDTALTSYDILGGISDVAGSKGFFISTGESPAISSTCKIIPDLDFNRSKYNMIPIQERIRIGIHTGNAVLTKYLYYIVIYILQARRDTMIRRWLELTHFSSSDFLREPDKMPENVFTRWITLDAITRLVYKVEKDDLASDTGIVVRTEREEDETERKDEDQFNVRTVLKTT